MRHPTTEAEGRVDRVRMLAERATRRLGGVPAVRTLLATLKVYDGAGGGLMASGLAYTALIALLPGLLLAVSVFGLVIHDNATREEVVAAIATAVPPLEDLARTAFQQASAGAIPTGLIGVVGLLWGASRFYAALDSVFSRVFHGARRRNELERMLRGVVVTALLVAVPMTTLLVGPLVAWLVEQTPDGLGATLWQLATPIGSFLLFVVGTALVFRFVPASPVPSRVLLRPAILVGLVLAVISQAFTLVAPNLTRIAAIYGPFVAVFALLAWLAISFNVLLLGASWTRVRALAMGPPPALSPAEPAGPAGPGRPPAVGAA